MTSTNQTKSKMQIAKVISLLCDFHKSLCLLNLVLHWVSTQCLHVVDCGGVVACLWESQTA